MGKVSFLLEAHTIFDMDASLNKRINQPSTWNILWSDV